MSHNPFDAAACRGAEDADVATCAVDDGATCLISKTGLYHIMSICTNYDYLLLATILTWYLL